MTPLRGGWEVFRQSLFDEAGYAPGDMQFVEAYDDYPIMVAIQLEDLGFCAKGEVGPFLERTRLTFDGDLPLNTGGGQLSCGQTGGGGGMIGITEAIRQLRGEGGARQVKARSAAWSPVTAWSPMAMASPPARSCWRPRRECLDGARDARQSANARSLAP